MILSGLGCRLQTCSCLATEWFNSTFRARLFNCFFLPNWILECELAQRTSDPRLEMSLQSLFFAAQVFPCEYIHVPHPCPPRGKPKNSEKRKKNSCILSVLGNLQLESDPRFFPFTCLFTYSVIYPLVYLITHALIKQSNIYSFDHLFIHIFNKYLLADCAMPSPALSGLVDTLMTTKP